MEEIPTIHAQLPAAELPVGAQQKMVVEDTVLAIAENPPANEAEIGNKLFVSAAPDSFPLAAVVPFYRETAYRSFLRGTIAKMSVTYAEDGPQDAVTRRFVVQGAKTQTPALGAGGRREGEGVGSCPFHEMFYSFFGESTGEYQAWLESMLRPGGDSSIRCE
jgi:hypothetical protein